MFFDVLISLRNLFDEVINWDFRHSDPVSFFGSKSQTSVLMETEEIRIKLQLNIRRSKQSTFLLFSN